MWHRQGTDRNWRPSSSNKGESACPFLGRAVPSPWHSVLVSSGGRSTDWPGPGEGGWRVPLGSPPPGGEGGVKGLCFSRICTPPENPATSTRLTKDTRGLRGGCDARGCYRGMDECTLRSRAEQEGSGPASPGRRRACVRRDNGSELQARPSLAGLVEAAGVPG